jgi:hypothetical protein
MQTYSSALEYEFKKLVDEAIEEELRNIAQGNIQNFEEYKSRTGFIRGLYFAISLIEQADTNMQNK